MNSPRPPSIPTHGELTQDEFTSPFIDQDHLYSINGSPSKTPISSQSPDPASPLKRPRSQDIEDEFGEKRQRTKIKVEDQDEQIVAQVQLLEGLESDNDAIAAMIAEATASVELEFAKNQKEDQDMDKKMMEESLDDNFVPKEVEMSSDTPMDTSILYMRAMSFPMLDSLSTQILTTLSQGPWAETRQIFDEPESVLGEGFASLKTLFDGAKRIYSSNPFLSADDLNVRDPQHRTTIQISNLATFTYCIQGGTEVDLYELNDNFVNSWTTDGILEPELGDLFLSLKTQLFLSEISSEEAEVSKEDSLDRLFPESYSELLGRQPLDAPIIPNEAELVQNLRERKEYLRRESVDADSIQSLSEQFSWDEFLDAAASYLREHYEPLLGQYMKRYSLSAPSQARFQNQIAATIESPELTDADEFAALTAKAAEESLRSLGILLSDSNQNTMHQSPYQQTQQSQSGGQTQNTSGSIPYPTQTAPTQVLYEQARQAAVAKTHPGNNRRPGVPSQRRPWSTEEENALMAGLDQVKGPHWSQILALYGPGGQISEILRDRNQVQLKDKARNLKLFFLKSNIEVPYYLQCVTGELKTRAPTQAARKEAEERARNTSEDAARFNTVMALAAGMQDSQSQCQNGSSQLDENNQLENGQNGTSRDSGAETSTGVTPDPESKMDQLSRVGSSSPPLSQDETLYRQLLAANAGLPAASQLGGNSSPPVYQSQYSKMSQNHDSGRGNSPAERITKTAPQAPMFATANPTLTHDTDLNLSAIKKEIGVGSGTLTPVP